jgi:hypothetical protein
MRLRGNRVDLRDAARHDDAVADRSVLREMRQQVGGQNGALPSAGAPHGHNGHEDRPDEERRTESMFAYRGHLFPYEPEYQ